MLKTTLAALSIAAALVTGASAAPVVISPTEATSEDTFIYSFADFPFFNASYLGASVESSGQHTVRSLIRFDLGVATLAAGESASFSIYARSKTGTAFSNAASDASAANPVTVDVYRVTAAWTESGVSYAAQPGVDVNPIGSFVVSDLNKYYSVDITPTVAAWIADPTQNFGLALRQRSVVPVAGGPDAAAVFMSAAGTNRPTLQIVVPEPASLAAVAGLAMLAGRRRASR